MPISPLAMVGSWWQGRPIYCLLLPAWSCVPCWVHGASLSCLPLCSWPWRRHSSLDPNAQVSPPAAAAQVIELISASIHKMVNGEKLVGGHGHVQALVGEGGAFIGAPFMLITVGQLQKQLPKAKVLLQT